MTDSINEPKTEKSLDSRTMNGPNHLLMGQIAGWNWYKNGQTDGFVDEQNDQWMEIFFCVFCLYQKSLAAVLECRSANFRCTPAPTHLNYFLDLSGSFIKTWSLTVRLIQVLWGQGCTQNLDSGTAQWICRPQVWKMQLILRNSNIHCEDNRIGTKSSIKHCLFILGCFNVCPFLRL